VLLLKFWEGAIVSLSAFLCGVNLAYCHVFFFSASLFEHPLKGWSVLYPQFKLTPVIDPYQLAVLFFLTVVPIRPPPSSLPGGRQRSTPMPHEVVIVIELSMSANAFNAGKANQFTAVQDVSCVIEPGGSQS